MKRLLTEPSDKNCINCAFYRIPGGCPPNPPNHERQSSCSGWKEKGKDLTTRAYRCTECRHRGIDGITGKAFCTFGMYPNCGMPQYCKAVFDPIEHGGDI